MACCRANPADQLRHQQLKVPQILRQSAPEQRSEAESSHCRQATQPVHRRPRELASSPSRLHKQRNAVRCGQGDQRPVSPFALVACQPWVPKASFSQTMRHTVALLKYKNAVPPPVIRAVRIFKSAFLHHKAAKTLSHFPDSCGSRSRIAFRICLDVFRIFSSAELNAFPYSCFVDGEFRMRKWSLIAQ
jgi:hypothetical protein